MLEDSSRQTALQKRPRGFTLIEIMIVVAILGVLAALAIPLFSRYIRKTKTSEVVWMFNQIRLKQEQYHGFFGQYASTPDWYPQAIGPNLNDNPWDPQGNDKLAWESLGIRPQSKYTYFQYRVWAGPAGTAGEHTGMNGIDINRSDWWYAQAQGDLDGDGEKSFFETTSQRQEVFSRNDVE